MGRRALTVVLLLVTLVAGSATAGPTGSPGPHRAARERPLDKTLMVYESLPFTFMILALAPAEGAERAWNDQLATGAPIFTVIDPLIQERRGVTALMTTLHLSRTLLWIPVEATGLQEHRRAAWFGSMGMDVALLTIALVDVAWTDQNAPRIPIEGELRHWGATKGVLARRALQIGTALGTLGLRLFLVRDRTSRVHRSLFGAPVLYATPWGAGVGISGRF